MTIFGGKGKLFVLSILVGLMTAIAVVILKTLAHSCNYLVVSLVQRAVWMQWLYPAFPALGILFCILFVRFILRREQYVKSLDSVIQATTDGSGEIPFYHTFAHILTSGIAVGLGGSAGLEAPSAFTGSAIGSNCAKWLKLSKESRVLLLACGGAAGIAAVFNSPIAGTLFACEILLPAFSLPALAPLLMASATAALLASWLYAGPHFIQWDFAWNMMDVPSYLLIGLVCGLVSAYIIKLTLLVSRQMARVRSIWLKGLLGSGILYGFFLLFPQLMGEGYKYISALAKGQLEQITSGPLLVFFDHPLLLLILLPLFFLIKPLVSGLSIESGGDGGIFGPSLFCGAFLGYFLYRVLTLMGIPGLSSGAFICAGMGGILAGVMHAPLTGIFLIAELTGGFKLFVPLMIVSALSSFVSKNLTRFNLYKSMIAQKGIVPEPKEEQLFLEHGLVRQAMQTNFVAFRQNQPLRELLKTMLETRQDFYPVLEEDGGLAGIIREEDIRPFFLSEGVYDLLLACDVMLPPDPILHSSDTLQKASLFFDRMKRWYLPVCENGRFVGYLSKAEVLEQYRHKLNEKVDLF
ncbi:MAG: chloride channel protein [Lentisphaeria bacterium]